MDALSADHDVTSSFLPEGVGYAPASGQITGILSEMKETTEKDLADLTATEGAALTSFEASVSDTNKEIQTKEAISFREVDRLSQAEIERLAQTTWDELYWSKVEAEQNRALSQEEIDWMAKYEALRKASQKKVDRRRRLCEVALKAQLEQDLEQQKADCSDRPGEERMAAGAGPAPSGGGGENHRQAEAGDHAAAAAAAAFVAASVPPQPPQPPAAGAVAATRKIFRCHASSCPYLVHSDEEFGSFCCRKCHWRFVTHSVCKKSKHGQFCEGRWAPPSAPVAIFVAPTTDSSERPSQDQPETLPPPIVWPSWVPPPPRGSLVAPVAPWVQPPAPADLAGRSTQLGPQVMRLEDHGHGDAMSVDVQPGSQPSQGTTTDGAVAPARTTFRCHAPSCQFLVHSDEQFGSFCCFKCHWRFEHPWSACSKKHGALCEWHFAPSSAPVAAFTAPFEPLQDALQGHRRRRGQPYV